MLVDVYSENQEVYQTVMDWSARQAARQPVRQANGHTDR